jgi:anti-sigma28 factor (negative regulator of flagellin synthesis)
MRIDPKVAISPVTRDVREAPSATSKTGAVATGAAVVKLSAAGITASESGAASATTTTRLQTIRAMLDKGNYPVDLDLLASRIVDDDVLRAGRP